MIAILRWVALLAFGGPLLMGLDGRRRATGDGSGRTASGRRRASRVPLTANLAAFAVFFPLLVLLPTADDGLLPFLLAVAGSLVAVAGAAIVLRSRAALGAAWSFVPQAGEQSGLVTSGPYRLVRHPIYLGLSMLAGGEAVAFGNLPALLVTCLAVIPTFAWRARVEEALLTQVFGDRHVRYKEKTNLIIPYLL